MRLMTAFAILACATAAPADDDAPAAPTTPTDDTPVIATMVSDAAAAVPGTTITLGLKLAIAPKWHVYWTNPGETGFPTEAVWTGPGLDGGPAAGAPAPTPEPRRAVPTATPRAPKTAPGAYAAPTFYPAPIAFVSPGDLVSFGYSEETVLLTEVAIPADAAGTVTFGAKGKWLMCHDRCIPGKAEVSVTLPVAAAGAGTGAAGRSGDAGLVERYRAMVPKRLPSGALPEGVTATVRKASPDSLEASLRVDVAAGKVIAEDRTTPTLRRLALFPFVTAKGLVPDAPPAPKDDTALRGLAGPGTDPVKMIASPVTLKTKVTNGDSAAGPPDAVRAVLAIQRMKEGRLRAPEWFELTLPETK